MFAGDRVTISLIRLSKSRPLSFNPLTTFVSSKVGTVQQSQRRRLSSTQSSVTNGTNKGGDSSSLTSKEDANNCLLLYRRAPDRVWFPRSLLAFTTLHTGYWAWYVFDFVPAMNAAAPSDITVDSTVGYVGWAMSAFMWGFSCLYPKFLINEVQLNKTTKELLVKTYKLPFVTVPTNGTTAYSSLALDPKIVDMNKLFTNYNGNMSYLRGHLGVQITDERFTSPNLLLHLTENADQEIHRNHLLLQSLVSSTSSRANQTVMMTPNSSSGKNKAQSLNTIIDETEHTLQSTSDEKKSKTTSNRKMNKARQQQKIKQMKRRQMLSRRN